MIGIVILNYNTWKDTILCVDSIKRTTNCKYKIYIIDNNSTDDSFKQLKTKYQYVSDVVLIQSKVNGGYSAGNNIGIKKALSDGAEMVLLSNSDIIFSSNSICLLHKHLKRNPHVGIVGPQVLLSTGKVQHLLRENYTFKNYILTKTPFINFKSHKSNAKTLHNDYTYEDNYCFYGCLSGCCIGFSHLYFEKCGMLDENIFLYYEEAIIGLIARQNNLLSCLIPESKVLHKSSVSIGNKNSAFSRFHRYYSSMYALRKYAKINNLQLTIIFFINLFPFIVNSIIKKEYRNKLKQFIIQTSGLYKINNT